MQRLHIHLALSALLVAGCDSPTGLSPEGLAVAPEWVTGPAAEALDAARHFTFAPMVPGGDELSQQDAIAVAKAYFATVATSVGNLAAFLEEEHGAAINFASLSKCGRVIPILAPFLPTTVPAETQFARNMMAAKYEVRFCQQDGTSAVGVEVSVAAKVTISTAGTIRYPDPPLVYGNEFLPSGIPLRPTVDLSPEAAVRALYTLLGTPIHSVPKATGCLYSLNPCSGHQARFWRMETAVPVSIRRQGALQNELAQVFYVQASYGAHVPGGVYVASLLQPAPAYSILHFFRDQQPVTDSILLTLSEPLAMDPFTVASSSH